MPAHLGKQNKNFMTQRLRPLSPLMVPRHDGKCSPCSTFTVSLLMMSDLCDVSLYLHNAGTTCLLQGFHATEAM